ncbi:MAG: cytochrome c [Saprospiraceae bacterium]
MNKYFFFFALGITLYVSSCQTTPFPQGEAAYLSYCASCHMEDGKGLKTLIPPLAQADYLQKNSDDLACIIRNGLRGPIVVNGQAYDQPMSGIPNLSDVDINNILNYIKNAWGNDYGTIKLSEVQAQLEECK